MSAKFTKLSKWNYEKKATIFTCSNMIKATPKKYFYAHCRTIKLGDHSAEYFS